MLKLAPGLSLPDDVLTEALAVTGTRGSGKTYTSKKLVELMTDLGLPTCVIDPLGVWWGLRSSADGKKPGLPFVVLGGEKGDVPLEPTAGKIIAQWLLENPVPVILDLSGMRKAEQRRFVAAFLEEIYERNRNPLHLVVDECDLFCPQRPSKDFPMTLLGTMEDIVRRGRSKGLGITLISQRPAVIHKDVLTQVAVLIAMRLVSPQDRRAIHDWIETHGTPEERKLILDALPGLEPGSGFFYSPSFMGVLKPFKAHRAKTFDSSATPRLGERRIEPTAFAAVDLDVLSERMAESIERAKEKDPRHLQGEIAKLRRRVADLDAELDLRVQREHEFEPTVVERIVPARLDQRFALAVEGIRSLLDEVHTKLDEGYEGLAELEKLIQEADDAEGAAPAAPAPAPALRVAPTPPTPSHPSRPLRPIQGDADLNKVEKEILTVLAQFPDGRTRTQLAILTGRSHKSSGFKNALSSLRTSGALVGSNSDVMRATDSGLERLGSWDPLPEGRALYDHWASKLGAAEKDVLGALVAAWPQGLRKEEIAAATDRSEASSGFKNALSSLRTLTLLSGSNSDAMVASEIFFTHGDWR